LLVRILNYINLENLSLTLKFSYFASFNVKLISNLVISDSSIIPNVVPSNCHDSFAATLSINACTSFTFFSSPEAFAFANNSPSLLSFPSFVFLVSSLGSAFLGSAFLGSTVVLGAGVASFFFDNFADHWHTL